MQDSKNKISVSLREVLIFRFRINLRSWYDFKCVFDKKFPRQKKAIINNDSYSDEVDFIEETCLVEVQVSPCCEEELKKIITSFKTRYADIGRVKRRQVEARIIVPDINVLKYFCKIYTWKFSYQDLDDNSWDCYCQSNSYKAIPKSFDQLSSGEWIADLVFPVEYSTRMIRRRAEKGKKRSPEKKTKRDFIYMINKIATARGLFIEIKQ